MVVEGDADTLTEGNGDSEMEKCEKIKWWLRVSSSLDLNVFSGLTDI